MTTNKSTLFIISAPSGAGKTSLVDALAQQLSHVCVSISHTTRPIRPGEKEGVNYNFTTESDFNQMLKQDAFLEHAKVFKHHYGTAKSWVDQKLEGGDDVILEIDWQGAAQVRKKMPDCISIFILPPSRSALHQRLMGRGQDGPQIIEQRMAAAIDEMSHFHEFDYLVINDDFSVALEQLIMIIKTKRLALMPQKNKHIALLNSLLS